MTSSFLLQLDTQVGLAIKLNGGAAVTPAELIELAILTDPDVVEVKVWGDIEPTAPENAFFGLTQAEAPWIPVSELFTVALFPSKGLKRIGVLARDDVLNVAEATAEIVLGEEPAPPPTPPSVTPPQLPPTPEPERRTVRSRSRLQVCDRVSQGARVRSRAALHGDARWNGVAHLRGGSRVRASARGSLAARNIHRDRMEIHSGQTIKRTDIGSETAAILDLLDLL